MAGDAAAATQARAAILRDPGPLPAALGDVDIDALAAASDGFTGADLKRLVEDGKILFAYDREKKGRTQPVDEVIPIGGGNGGETSSSMPRPRRVPERATPSALPSSIR